MNQEIIKEVTRDETGETYLAYANLRNANSEIRKAIVAKLHEQLQPIAQELGLTVVDKYLDPEIKADEYLFTTSDLKNYNLEFGFGLDKSEYRDFFLGFARIDPKQPNPLELQIGKLFVEAGFKASPPDPSGRWPVAAYCDRPKDWDDETMAAILSGDFAKELKLRIENLRDIATKAVAFNK